MITAYYKKHVVDVQTNKAKLIVSIVKSDENRMVHGTYCIASSYKNCPNAEIEPPSTLLLLIHCILQLLDLFFLAFDLKS